MELPERKFVVDGMPDKDEISFIDEILVYMMDYSEDDINEWCYNDIQVLLETYSNKPINWKIVEDDVNYKLYNLTDGILSYREVEKYMSKIKFKDGRLDHTINKTESKEIIKRIRDEVIQLIKEYIEIADKNDEWINEYFVKKD